MGEIFRQNLPSASGIYENVDFKELFPYGNNRLN